MGVRFFTPLLLFILGWLQAPAQQLAKYKQDTVSLARFEYTKVNTGNGSDCICYISNPGVANIAIAVNTGAPDSLRFSNGLLFNGVHTLAPGQQFIAVGNFQGKQVVTMNLSPLAASLVVMFYCPRD